MPATHDPMTEIAALPCDGGRVAPSSPFRMAEDARQAHLDVALDETEHAVELVAIETELRHQAPARAGQEIVARLRDATRGRRAVDAEHAPDVVDGEMLEHVRAEDVAFFGVEIGGGLLERAPELVAIVLLQIAELRIVSGVRHFGE